jgi:putative nucleotidyltransferase with HDIG domain
VLRRVVEAPGELSTGVFDMARPIPEGLLKSIDKLEPLPVTAQALTKAITDGDASFAKLADLIELDQAVAANVLRMTRTAAYAGRQPVSSVREALVRLGTNTLLDLVLGEYMKKLRVSAPMYDLTEDDLWLHSAASQLAVRSMQQEVPNAKIPSSAVTAALLHDIGKLVMVRHLKADVKVIVERCKQSGETWVEAENALFGTDHAAVGGAIARKWSFPDEITEAIERHHDGELPESTPVVDAVVTANFVAKTIGVGLGGEGLNLRVDMECPRRLGLDFDAFCRVCVQTTSWLDDIRQQHNVAVAKPRVPARG